MKPVQLNNSGTKSDVIKNGNLMIIDGHAQLYRGFHGVPPLCNSRGEQTNAIYAVARFLIWLDKTYPHEFGVVTFDKGMPRKKLELLPQYKAQRTAMPEELRSQIPAVREWIAAAGWNLIEEEGREADDLIAAIVKERQGHPAYIVSYDKDLGQLVEDSVIQLIPGPPGSKTRLQELSPTGILEKFGVPPQAIPDYLAMVGDSSDNIPGLPGVGAKTAALLLQRFGDIDTMLEHADDIEKPALREKVRNSRELLKKNLELVVLDSAPPATWSGLEGLRRRSPDWPRLRSFALDHDFKSLLPVIEEGLEASRNPMLL